MYGLLHGYMTQPLVALECSPVHMHATETTTSASHLCQPMGSVGDSNTRRNLHRPGIAKEGRSKTKPRTATINPHVQQTGPLTVGRWGVGCGVTVLSMCYGLPQMPSRLPSQVLPDGGATSGCCGQCLPRAGVMSDHFLIPFF